MGNGGGAIIAPAGRRGAVLSAFLAVALAFTTVVSALCLLEFEDHDCTGDDCAICLVLETAQAAMSSASAGIAPAIAIGTALALLCLVPTLLPGFDAVAQTPVSLKVKIVV